MDRRLVVTVGFPVAPVGEVDGAESGELPAGDYAVVEVVGHPDGLAEATGALLAWGDANGHEWDADGVHWASRLEEYLSDPAEVPDMDDWVTRLAIRVRSSRD
jgi:DNA gyrase inhibitor GyrI